MGKVEVGADIEIDAPQDFVWKILQDVGAWEWWNPWILQVDGDLKVGEKLSVEVEYLNGKRERHSPVVTYVKENDEMRWSIRLWNVAKLFDGEHVFTVKPFVEGKCVFEQRQVFSGWLVSAFSSSLNTETRHNMTEMNKALKKRAEERYEASKGSA